MISYEKFRPDDFYEIYKYIKIKNEINHNLVSPDTEKIQIPDDITKPRISKKNIVDYNNNYIGSGPNLREMIANRMNFHSAFGNLSADCITLAPSITSASINIIIALLNMGVASVGLATPCYYATKFQLEHFNIKKILLIPSYSQLDYNLNFDSKSLNCEVIWLTHPIISLTKDFFFKQLEQWINHATNKKRYLVIDEAVDCKSPTALNTDRYKSRNVEVIRIRSFLKQLSINGQRLAFIIASEDISNEISKESWISHGGIDIFSIESALWAIKNARAHEELCRLMLERCDDERTKIAKLLHGTCMSIPKYQNGYISHIKIDMTNWNVYKTEGHEPSRQKLIDSFATIGLLPTLSPSMYFAHENGTERLRLNYLGSSIKREKVLLKLISQLSRL